jgi:cytochrome c oxidase cbb3-type subunit 1/cytochrome c oxidase cbb3-type subunit I/II
VISHSHIAVLGFAGFIGLGGMYFIIPRITGRPLHSLRLVDIQYWLVLIGLTGFFLILTAAGLIQGNGWMNGATEYRLLPEIHVYMVMRLYSGMFIVFASYLGLYIFYKSLYGAPAVEEEQSPYAARIAEGTP